MSKLDRFSPNTAFKLGCDKTYIQALSVSSDLSATELMGDVIDRYNNYDKLKKENDSLQQQNALLVEALDRSNFAFKANLKMTSVKCELSMLEALERNEKLLKEIKGGK